MHAEAIRKLQQIMGKEGVVTDETELLVYECDAFTMEKNLPNSISATGFGNRTQRRRHGR